MSEPVLSNIHGCIDELQTCSRELATLDHEWAEVLDDESRWEEEWATIEATAASAARNGDTSLTATEIKGRITSYVNERPEMRRVRDLLADARKRKERLQRRFRSVERRLSAAQSAQNGHAMLARYGGGE